MPKLIIPTPAPTDSGSPLSIGGTTSAVQSGASIGQTQMTDAANATASGARIGETYSELGSMVAGQGLEFINQLMLL